MKKKLLVVGLCGVICLLVGAIGLEIAEVKSNTVSTWSDCLNDYFEMREGMPPLPLPTSPEELLLRAEHNDWSFIADEHWYINQPQTLYASEGSELVKALGTLPKKLMVMEDIRLGSIIIYSVDETGAWNPEAMFDAPAIIDETAPRYMNLSAEDKSRELYFELTSRRIIGEITLQPASVLTALLTRSTSASTEFVSAPLMMTMSVPATYSNAMWLAISGTNLTVNVSVGFTNRVEIYSCSNLVSNIWNIAETNLTPVSTNPATWSAESEEIRFFRSGNMDVDVDGDGLPDAREQYVHKTDPSKNDTDGDLLPDGWELANQMNPLSSADGNADPDDDGATNGEEFEAGSSWYVVDTDGDGYSDGTHFPAGYTNVMRGLNDAFPTDAAAWRDSDGDGLPNEVVGASALVEDRDDDGDGEEELTGVWITAAEVSGLSTNNVNWTNLVEEADQIFFGVYISDQDDRSDVISMAKALVYARTGNSIYKTDVIDACAEAVGSEAGGDSLALGRNLSGFIIAADLVDLPRTNDMEFRDWLRTMLTNSMSDSLSLTMAHEAKSDDAGTHAGGARAAIAAYLQEWDELDDVATVFKGWTGDRESYDGFSDFGTNLTWQADTNNPVGINPLGAEIDGHSVDGALPVAQQESGGFSWPPEPGDFAYEALQGALLQAVILDRAGYDVWEWEDKALIRAYEWVEEEAQTNAVADDTWQPFVVQYCAPVAQATPVTSAHGKNIAPTDWSHPQDYDSLPGGWEVEYGLDPTDATGNNGDDGDPDEDGFSNLHEYLIGTDPNSDISSVEDLVFDETLENITFKDQTRLVQGAATAFSGTNCIEFLIANGKHYKPYVQSVPEGGSTYSFTDADEFRFYIRTASGQPAEPFYLKLIYSFNNSVDMSSLDIQPYLYELDGTPSTNITAQYKMAKIPFADMRNQYTNQFSGVFRRIQMKVSSDQADTMTNFAFYVDRISLQDTTGLTVESIEPFDAYHLEVTCSDKLDFISARTISNHFLSVSNNPVEITGIGLCSWVEGFRNSQAGSPIVKHYITLQLAEPLIEGQTVAYFNNVQDVSGNYPANSSISFTYSETNVSSSIKVNQVGWLPEATKIAYIGNYLGDLGPMSLDTNLSHTATVQDVGTGLNVYTSQLVQTENPDYFEGLDDMPVSGEEVWRIDLSSVQTPGEYRIAVPGIGRSVDFEIGTNIYADTYYHCMRSLWYQRSGISMTNLVWCGQWTRIGDIQQNTNTAFYHNSIYDKSFELYDNEDIGGYADFSGGWYDAADYNRYTKSAADAVNLLLTMYEIKPERFLDNQLNIPESGNGIPDVLDEAKWELDWICKMVSSNGAAFNKITYENWPSKMPGEQTGKMWATLKTTRDTAAACAILAKASRIYEPYDSTSAALYSNKAVLAWQCLTNHLDSYPLVQEGVDQGEYNNPPGTNWVVNGVTNIIPDVNSGTYFSTNDMAYRMWSAIEMYLLTGQSDVHLELSNMVVRAQGASTISDFVKDVMYGSDGYSGSTRGITMFYDYICLTNSLPVFEDIQTAMSEMFIYIVDDGWLERDLPYDFELKSYSNIGFGEGSQIKRPYGYILAYELTGDINWLERARINLDWPLGANPLSTSYITGIGDKYPMFPHNKFDHGDGVDEPIPGYNIYGLAETLEDRDFYSAILDNSYPFYRAVPDEPVYPVGRKYVDTWESVSHGEFVIDDLARTAMVFAYFSSTNAP